MVPWHYSGSQQTFINHNDAESVSHKLDCIVDQDLGGIMFWKLSGDDAQHSLIHPMAGTLRTASP